MAWKNVASFFDGAIAFGHRSGAWQKAILLINGEFRAETTRFSKCNHLLHDGSVCLDFMTDDVNEAEEMRIQTVGHWFPLRFPKKS